MIGERIKQRRKAARLTQQQLAEQVGVSRAAVAQWESGDTKSVRPAHLLAAAKALGADIEWLITGRATVAPLKPTGAAVDDAATAAPGQASALLRRFMAADRRTQDAIRALLNADKGGLDIEWLRVATEKVCQYGPDLSSDRKAAYIAALYVDLREGRPVTDQRILKLVRSR